MSFWCYSIALVKCICIPPFSRCGSSIFTHAILFTRMIHDSVHHENKKSCLSSFFIFSSSVSPAHGFLILLFPSLRPKHMRAGQNVQGDHEYQHHACCDFMHPFETYHDVLAESQPRINRSHGAIFEDDVMFRIDKQICGFFVFKTKRLCVWNKPK